MQQRLAIVTVLLDPRKTFWIKSYRIFADGTFVKKCPTLFPFFRKSKSSVRFLSLTPTANHALLCMAATSMIRLIISAENYDRKLQSGVGLAFNGKHESGGSQKLL